jgi:hypothetical protein
MCGTMIAMMSVAGIAAKTSRPQALGEVALLDIVLDRRRGRPGAGIDARDVVAGALHGGGKIGRLEPVRIEGDFDKCMATLVRTSPTPVRRRSDVDTRPTQ